MRLWKSAKSIIVILTIMSTIVCSKKNSTNPGENHTPDIITLVARPSSLGQGAVSNIKVTVEDEDNDNLKYYWSCSGGTLNTSKSMLKKYSAMPAAKTKSDSIDWTAPYEDGTYRIDVTISDGIDSVSENVNIEVKGIFYDTFTDTLPHWYQHYCDFWIADSAMHIKGNKNLYDGDIQHTFNPFLKPEYKINMKIARSTETDTAGYYGINFQVNDIGVVAVKSYFFVIYPDDTTNWALLAYYFDGFDSRWTLLKEDSKGSSPLIRTGEGEYNDIFITIKSDKTIIIEVDGSLLYQTDELLNIESSLGRELNLDLTAIAFRTSYEFESQADHVYVPKLSEENYYFEKYAYNSGNNEDIQAISKSPESLPILSNIIKSINR